MNSIERVEAVLTGQRPDRVPLGFYVVDCDTVSNVIGRDTYVRNKVAQQIALWEGRRDELTESLKADTIEFFDKIDLCDIITVKEARPLPSRNEPAVTARKINDETWEDQFGRVFKVSTISNEFVCVEDPVAAGKTYSVDDFSLDKPVPDIDESVFEAVDFVFDHFAGSRFLLGLGSLGAQPMLGGREMGLMQYAMDPDLIKAAVARNIQVGNAQDDARIRKGQNGVLFEEDYGTTRAPMVSPTQFRDISLPALTARFGNVKAKGQRAFLHSCGNTWQLLDMFVESGLQCYQSLQTDAGMDISKLRDQYGGQLTFWGGIAVETLVTGAVDDVRANVRNAASVARDGGVILGPSHSVAYGVPYDNFMAMLDEFSSCAAC